MGRGSHTLTPSEVIFPWSHNTIHGCLQPVLPLRGPDVASSFRVMIADFPIGHSALSLQGCTFQ